MIRRNPNKSLGALQRAIELSGMVFLLSLSAHAVQAGELRVAIEGVRGDRGTVRVAVYRAGSGFLKPGQEHAAMFQRAVTGDLFVIFGGLPADRYAVAVYHDENANGELDSNLLGIPLEGTGFSEGAVPGFGPPSFNDAALSVPTDGQASTRARLSY